MFRILLVTCALMITPLQSHAAKVQGIAAFTAHFGGDQLMPSTFTYTDGSKPDIDAGRGLDLIGGVVADVASMGNHAVSVMGTVGYRFTTIVAASNGNVTWTHIPVDVIAIFKPNNGKLGLGAGITYHLNNKLDGTGVATGVTADYDNALGYQAYLEYKMGEKFLLYGKYQLLNYVRSSDAYEANANNFGVGVGFLF
jgi:hypothetical protein